MWTVQLLLHWRNKTVSTSYILEHKITDKVSLFMQFFITFYNCQFLCFYLIYLNTNVKNPKLMVTDIWYI